MRKEPPKPGQRFGRLTAIRCTHPMRRIMWLFRCDCGVECEKLLDSVRCGRTTSCGCRHREGKTFKHREARRAVRSPEYTAWLGMISRCYRSSHPKFSDYGGRGIYVASQWRNSFTTFLDAVGRRPSPQHSLDRFPDNNGPYAPGNVRWATAQEQTRNRRNSRRVIFNGQEMTLVAAADLVGLKHWLVRERIKMGWSVDAALSIPVRPHKPYVRGGAPA
jgi:hypothetical protein